MFANAVPLKFAEHRDLKLLETSDYSYARSEVLAPIVFDEIADIAREYPIVFPANGSGLPAALLGLEKGQNAYVAEDGRWLGTYVPAHIRRYPFVFGETGAKEGDKLRYIVLCDPQAPHFKGPNGYPVFAADGQLSDLAKRRVDLTGEIQKKLPATKGLVAAIDAAGLLVERVITIRKPGQPEHRVQGLRVIDEKKLNALPHDQFAALRDKGALPLVYAHLLSWANFRQGPLAGKYPSLAPQPARAGGDFSLLFEDDGMVNLAKMSQ